MQYLNSSDVNKDNHKCMSCPLGASCEGNIDWSGVKAKYGWWRLRNTKEILKKLRNTKECEGALEGTLEGAVATNNTNHPPDCLLCKNDCAVSLIYYNYYYYYYYV